MFFRRGLIVYYGLLKDDISKEWSLFLRLWLFLWNGSMTLLLSKNLEMGFDFHWENISKEFWFFEEAWWICDRVELSKEFGSFEDALWYIRAFSKMLVWRGMVIYWDLSKYDPLKHPNSYNFQGWGCSFERAWWIFHWEKYVKGMIFQRGLMDFQLGNYFKRGTKRPGDHWEKYFKEGSKRLDGHWGLLKDVPSNKLNGLLGFFRECYFKQTQWV